MAAQALDTPDLQSSLVALLGADRVVLDPVERHAASADVYSEGATCAAVVRPADTEQLAAAVAYTTRAGYAVIPRGGGLTYTGGYTPPHERSVIVDCAGLDRIVEVSADNMYVTAQAGVTWKSLHAALAPLGLRLPCFGTFSGARATVGGGLSNGALFFGSARWGTVADSLLGLEVVLADGTRLHTGQRALRSAQRPFYRTFGPDLTGLFVHDGGTLGVKTEATFRLIRAPTHTGYLSFAFGSLETSARALSEVARAGVAEDAYVLDPLSTRQSVDGADLAQALRTLGAVVRGGSNWLQGLKDGARMAAAGRDFGAHDVHSLHVVAAAQSAPALEADLEACRALAAQCGGTEIPASMPRAARADLFPPPNGVLGTTGERWAALNAKVAHSDALALVAEGEALLARHAAEFEKHGIWTTRLLIALSNHSFSYEPVFRWRDAWLPIHRRAADPRHLAKFTEPLPNPAARDLVHRARAEMVELFARHGAASNQIGRTYPYFDRLEAPAAELLAALKRAVDPDGRQNPGALGLGGGGSGLPA
ncbi:MAG: FAD-binding oxidoreductase [Pseudomonadota bacterium]